MPKSIVPSPAAVVAVDRLTLQATDARATDHYSDVSLYSYFTTQCSVCFSEE
jgi:hypothetical protein